MKKMALWVGLVVIVVAVGLVWMVNVKGKGVVMNTADSPQNATYTIEGSKVTLTNGKAEVIAAPGSSAKEEISLFGQPTVGDLNGDGVNDAAVILVDATSGTGTFYYVSGALNVNGKYVGLNAQLLGDRVAPQTVEIKDGVIIANFADRNPGEPMSTEPSLGVSKYLALQNGALVVTAQPFEVNFTETGTVVNKGSVSVPKWTLVYEQPGAPALTVTLAFNDKSVCNVTATKTSCVQFSVANGTKATVAGQNIDGVVTVSTLSVVK